MSRGEWEDFVHSSTAVGTAVWIVVPPGELEIRIPLEIGGMRVVQFDRSVGSGYACGVVVAASYCGWLKIEVADHGVVDVPGWYLLPVGGLK